jgi:hypothetical protein
MLWFLLGIISIATKYLLRKIKDFFNKYCDKEFDSLKGVTCHENLYCKLKNNKQNVCYRCGRDGHYSTDCYASKHINGKYLN